jgi:hypothetical protein
MLIGGVSQKKEHDTLVGWFGEKSERYMRLGASTSRGAGAVEVNAS